MSSSRLDATLDHVFGGQVPQHVADLGRPRLLCSVGFYWTLRGSLLIGSGLLFGATVAAGIVFALWQYNGGDSFGVGITLLFAAILLFLWAFWDLKHAWEVWQVGECRLIACTKGFVFWRNRTVRVVRWEQIPEVTWDRTEVSIEYQNIQSWVEGDEGRPFLERDGAVKIHQRELSNLGQFWNLLVDETAPHILARLVPSFNDGKDIDFGGLVLNRQGIGYEDDTLEWQNLGEVDVMDGRVWVYERNIAESGRRITKEPWVDLNVWDIANLFVFLALVRHIRQRGSGPVSLADVTRDAQSRTKRSEQQKL